MTSREFQTYIEQLQEGDEAILDRLFLDHYDYCTDRLCKKFSTSRPPCTRADANDLFMDALLKLRLELLKGKVENKNLRGYLLTIANRIWLKKLERQPAFVPLEVDQIEYFLGKKEGWEPAASNHLIAVETAADLDAQKQERLALFQTGWQALSEQCRRLLQAFYLDGRALKDLQIAFGYGSYDSVKSMRRKCFNKLARKVEEA